MQRRLKDAAVRAVAIVEAQGSVFRRALDERGMQGARDIAMRLEAAKEAAYLEVLQRTRAQATRATEEEQRVAAQLSAMEAALTVEVEAAQLRADTEEMLPDGPARTAFLAKSLAEKVAALREAVEKQRALPRPDVAAVRLLAAQEAAFREVSGAPAACMTALCFCLSCVNSEPPSL